jgi:PST family polysaccharide transporter
MSETLNPISIIKSKLAKNENKTLFNNFIALFILQLMNYALPLIILPYLTQKLGPANYGKVAWAQYAIQYLIFFTDYGFHFSANRLISVDRNNPENVNRIFNSVMLIKFFLMLVSYSILFIWMQQSGLAGEDKLILNISFLMVFGAVLMPVWLYQGMEKMKWMTIINIVFKILLVISVFVFVSKREDVIMTAWLMAGSNALIGIFTLITAIRIFKIRIFFPEFKDVSFQFKEGWLVFLTTVFTAVYVTSNGFLLGELAGDTSLGYYTPAEKIVRAVASFFNPVMFALYPFITKKFADDRKEATRLFFKLLYQISIITFIASVMIFLFAPLTDDLLGDEYSASIRIIQWLAFIPFFGTAGALLSYHLFLNAGLKKFLPWILLILAVGDILLCYWLIPIYQEEGAAISLLIVEITAPVSYLVIYYFTERRMLS